MKLCNSAEKLSQALLNNDSYNTPDSNSSYIYGAWAMEYASKFKYFQPKKLGSGLMEDGSRIGSPGKIQEIISMIKQIYYKIK